MTPEDLEDLIMAPEGHPSLAAAFTGLDEKTRARLSSAARKINNQLQSGKVDKDASPRLAAFVSARPPEVLSFLRSPESRRAILALFALCPLSVVSKRDIMVYPDEYQAFVQIIEDRRPIWLDDWIAFDLARDFRLLNFPTLRRWIKSGLCQKPEVDGYYTLYAAHLMRTGFYSNGEVIPPLSRQLLDDPDLLADIDGLFRVETIAFNTNSWLVKGAAADFETWPDALVRLSVEGHLDRGHLLNLALDGLKLDLKQNQLSGFHGVYNRLAPTAEEMRDHQPAYIALLCHPVGHVAKFAIDRLAQVEKQGALDAGAVLDEIAAVFTADSKGNATAALKLLQRIITRGQSPEHTPDRALAVVAEALRHAHADVQALALDILEKHAAILPAHLRDSLAGQTDFVAASLRTRLQTLTQTASTRQPSLPAATTAEPYDVVSADINDHRVLFADDVITPITSLDDLIAAVSHAVEVVESPDDIERIIDAISRLAGDRPADFAARTAPLLHRLRTGHPPRNGLRANQSSAGLAINDLVLTWLTDRYRVTTVADVRYYAREPGLTPLALHLQAITVRVVRHHGQALLSAPTHRNGWIDPRIWVARLAAFPDLDVTESMDLRLSLLRLAPDHRAEALAQTQAQAAALPDTVRRLAIFALGGDERPLRTDRKSWAAWITAARCRAPDAVWAAEFAEFDLADAGPGGVRPARYDWIARYRHNPQGHDQFKFSELAITVRGDGPDRRPTATGGLLSKLAAAVTAPLATDWPSLPTVAFNRPSDTGNYFWQGDLSTTWMAQWLPYVWPQHPAAACMKAARMLMARLDENSSGEQPGFGYFHVLFQNNRPWGEAAHLLLCIGLLGKDADAKGLAIDALIEGIDGRRFDPALFASVMTRLCAGEWVKHNRLADGLMLAIPVSPLHAQVMADALETWLPTLDLQQKGAFRILEVLTEARAVSPHPLPEPARSALAAITGGGKATKLARQLLSS